MNEQIKKRIEQIRRGEVPEGYKKTNAGIVPAEWNGYHLGDIYIERKGAGNPDLPVLSVSIHSGVSDGELDEDELGKQIKRITDKTQYKNAFAGDLVFNMMRAWQGAIGVVQAQGLVSPAYIVAKPQNVIYPQFMDCYMKTPRMIATINRQSYGVTDFRKRLYWDSFSLIYCALPSIQEQEKIAAILAAQDKIIELQQQMIEELQKLKRACLQKMFPQKGQIVPDTRFPGFTDAWEQRECGELYSERHENGDETLPILSVSIHSGISDGEMDEENLGKFIRRSEDKTKYKKVYSGDLVFNMMRAWQGAIGVAKNVGMVSPAYITAIPNGEVYPPFMDVCLRRKDIVSQINNLSYGVTDFRKRLYWESFVKVQCIIPAIEEQKKITNFFNALNNHIALHQRKLEEMQKHKKTLMQLLLTGVVRVKV